MPRSAHRDWHSTAQRLDTIDLLAVSNQGRIPELIPIRFGRILQSSFAFLRGEVEVLFEQYRDTLQSDRQFLLDRYRLVDVAMKVVGVGSVGTHCGVALLLSNDHHPLLLQYKEARPSVLEP